MKINTLNAITFLIAIFIGSHSIQTFASNFSKSDSHRFYTDTSFRYPGELAITHPKKGLLVAQQRFKLTTDYIYKLIEAQCYASLSKYDEAINICIYSLEQQQVKNDYFLKSSFHFQIGNLFHELDDYKNSLEWYTSGKRIGDIEGDLNIQIGGNSGIAIALEGLGELDLAEEKYLQSISLYQTCGLGETFDRYSCESNLAGIYHKREKYDTSLVRFKLAYAFFKKNEHYEFACISSSGIASSFIELGEKDSSYKYLSLSLEYAKLLESPNLISYAQNNLASYYQRFHEFEKGLIAMDSMFHYYKIYKQEENLASINQVMFDYELEKKVMQLDYQSMELQRTNAELNASEDYRLLLTVLFVFLIILILGGLYLMKTRRDQEKIELDQRMSKLELKALQAQMNPHFIFNCLSSIQHLFMINKEIEANNYMTKFSILLRSILEHSKVEEITLEDELNMLRIYCDLENLQFDNPFEINIQIDIQEALNMIEIPSMLFQPFVENAINHGLKNLENKGELKISFKLEQETLIGIIEDNGIGRLKAKQLKDRSSKEMHKSRGIEITNERTEIYEHAKNLKINTYIHDKYNAINENCGTVVRVEVPIK